MDYHDRTDPHMTARSSVSLNDNPVVRKAYEDRTYTDTRGRDWRRGLDGWFLDDVDGRGGIMLCRHQDFVEMIEKEHPTP